MKNKLISILLCALFSLPSAAWAEEGEERPDFTSRSRVTTDYFSTASMLQIFDDFSDPARNALFEETWQEIIQLLARLDAAFSISVPDSDISRFNALATGESTTLSQDTLEVLTLARRAFLASGGLYDPTVVGLVDLFGFTPRFSARDYRPKLGYDRPRVNGVLPPPDAAAVNALRTLVDYSAVQFTAGTLTKTVPPVTLSGKQYQQTLDLGGIGKGYAVDLVMDLLRERGYRYGYFSCGGSSIGILSRAKASSGAPEKAQWGVGVQYPRFSDRQEVLLRIFLKDRSLSTSGDYEHVFWADGVRYTHLIDPRTGWPVNMPVNGVQKGICSVTVLGESAALCDALSTTLCVLGPKDAAALMNREEMRGYDYLMILFSDDADYCELVTDLPPESYQLLDPVRFVPSSRTDEGGRVMYTGTLFAEAFAQDIALE